MTGYQVTGFDCSAEGMERLRTQREAILIACLAGADETAESILAELVGDIQLGAWPEGVDCQAAEQAVKQWAAERCGLALIEAELRQARDAAERGELNWNQESADEFDSVSIRLYVTWPESAEFPRLSVCSDCLELVANGEGELEPEALAACSAGLKREQEQGAQLVADCSADCEGPFSWSPCELCRRPEGGARHRLCAIPGPAYRFDFDRLSGTGIIVRLSDDSTSLRYTGQEAAELVGATAERLAELFETESS